MVNECPPKTRMIKMMARAGCCNDENPILPKWHESIHLEAPGFATDLDHLPPMRFPHILTYAPWLRWQGNWPNTLSRQEHGRARNNFDIQSNDRRLDDFERRGVLPQQCDTKSLRFNRRPVAQFGPRQTSPLAHVASVSESNSKLRLFPTKSFRFSREETGGA